MLLNKKTVEILGSRLNETKSSKVSNFARAQMEKMGWKEGEGLGKSRTGATQHIKVAKKDSNSGIGCETKELDQFNSTESWWHDAFANNLSAFKVKGIKKSKKRKLDEEIKNQQPPSYEELFEATGGARLGMRARAKQTGKHLRTEVLKTK